MTTLKHGLIYRDAAMQISINWLKDLIGAGNSRLRHFGLSRKTLPETGTPIRKHCIFESLECDAIGDKTNMRAKALTFSWTVLAQVKTRFINCVSCFLNMSKLMARLCVTY